VPYLIETVKAGKVIEKRKKYSARYGIKGIPRSENINPSPEDVEKVNQNNSERSLRQRINANFQSGDFHAIPSFDGDWNPTPEEAREAFEKFLRKARALYKKEGTEFKYIFAMERGQTGQHKIHFHMVINYIDTRKFSSIWPWGRIKYFPLDDSGQYARLASYIIKRTSKTFKSGESPYKKRWTPSRNLIIPIPDNEVVSHSKWRKAPKAIWGYYIEKDKTVNGISKITGYPYQFYSMVQLNNMHDHRKVRKRE
jgi:hypothetical protein